MPHTSVIVRLELDHALITFVDVAGIINQFNGDITSIDVIRPGKSTSIRDLTIQMFDSDQERLVEALRHTEGIKVLNVSDRTFLMHLGGKIAIAPKVPIQNRDDLSMAYTPGVARVCQSIASSPNKAFTLTIKRNTVAVITDGTAVLGLGQIGPYAAAPVMEGKAMLFKQFAGVDAFPICLNTTDPEEIIRTIVAISPIFGGINLEDISSPRCFEIESRLQQALDIPVFHDDQHGTAIVVLASLFNALKVVDKKITDIRVVVNGIGAAGVSICRMLLAAGVGTLIPVDRHGAIVQGGQYEQPMWNWLAAQPQVPGAQVSLQEALQGADVFIGVSRGGLLFGQDVAQMAPNSIVFAMANPEPEISPDEALPFVRIYATGRSDYPNQINNVLVFPGIFRGALDCRANEINDMMKLAAARAIADVVLESELNEHYIVPSLFNDQVVPNIRNAVIKAAIATQAARRIPPDFR